MKIYKVFVVIKYICLFGAVILGIVLLNLLTTPGRAQQQFTHQQSPQAGILPTNTATALPQQPAGQLPVPVLDLEKQLLDFQNMLSQSAKDHQAFLQAQEERHQQFLEWYYNYSIKLFAACVGIIGLILAGLHFRTKGDVTKMVDERINADTDAQIAKAVKRTQIKFEQATTAANESITRFNQHLQGLQNSTQAHVNELKAKLESNNINILKVSSIISLASVILNQFSSENTEEKKVTNPRRRKYIQSLKEIQKWAPADRTIVIYIGRLYRQLGDYDSAIKELNNVINKRVERKENKGIYAQDHSDVLFNKACYLNLKVPSAGAEFEPLRKEAWKAISESTEIWPPNLADAKTDEDLKGLTNGVRTWESLKR